MICVYREENKAMTWTLLSNPSGLTIECMRKRQKAVDLTENRKRAPVARRQILLPPLRK